MNGLEEYALKRGYQVVKVYTTPGNQNPYAPSGPHLRAVVLNSSGKRIHLWFDPSPRPGRLKPRGWRKS